MNGENLIRQNQQMTLKPVPTSGRFKVTPSIVIRMNFEFNPTCRRKKHSIPLKNIDVTRSTDTDLDVMQEKRVDDYWNVDPNRNCQIRGKVSRSESIERKTSQRIYVGKGRREDRNCTRWLKQQPSTKDKNRKKEA